MRYINIDPNNCQEILEFIADTFPQVPNARFAQSLLMQSEIDWNNSFQAVDDNGRMLGFILFSTMEISRQCPVLRRQNPEAYNNLTNGNYTTIFLIGCNRNESRHGNINAKILLRHATGYLQQFDFIVLSIFEELTTHRLWQQLGAVPICRFMNGIFYIVPVRERREELINKIRESRINRIIRESIKHSIKKLLK